MSDDGADLNMPAEGAMMAALGGEQPEQLSDEAFEQMVRRATSTESYGSCANVAARMILEFLEGHPEAREYGANAVYDWDAVKGTDVMPRMIRKSLYDVMKESGVKIDELGLTGFMWGWAVNAARHILKLPSVPNPAIIEIG